MVRRGRRSGGASKKDTSRAEDLDLKESKDIEPPDNKARGRSTSRTSQRQKSPLSPASYTTPASPTRGRTRVSPSRSDRTTRTRTRSKPNAPEGDLDEEEFKTSSQFVGRGRSPSQPQSTVNKAKKVTGGSPVGYSEEEEVWEVEEEMYEEDDDRGHRKGCCNRASRGVSRFVCGRDGHECVYEEIHKDKWNRETDKTESKRNGTQEEVRSRKERKNTEGSMTKTTIQTGINNGGCSPDGSCGHTATTTPSWGMNRQMSISNIMNNFINANIRIGRALGNALTGSHTHHERHHHHHHHEYKCSNSNKTNETEEDDNDGKVQKAHETKSKTGAKTPTKNVNKSAKLKDNPDKADKPADKPDSSNSPNHADTTNNTHETHSQHQPSHTHHHHTHHHRHPHCQGCEDYDYRNTACHRGLRRALCGATRPVRTLLVLIILGTLISLGVWQKDNIQTQVNNIFERPIIGNALAAKGLKAHHPIVIIPGIVSTGLEVWKGLPCVANRFRQRIWGSTVMLQAVLLNSRCWLDHLKLNITTGLDPEGIKLRPAQGLEAADYLLPGFWIWARFIEDAAAIGYDPNSFAMHPYDWRLSFAALEIRDAYFTKLKALIEHLRHLNHGRKVVLTSHSMGVLVTQYFFKWVEHPLGGNGGPSWVNDNIHAVTMIGAPHLGVPKAVSALLSGEMRDTAEMAAWMTYLRRRALLSNIDMTGLLRGFHSTGSMLPKGGWRVWGREADGAPDDRSVSVCNAKYMNDFEYGDEEEDGREADVAGEGGEGDSDRRAHGPASAPDRLTSRAQARRERLRRREMRERRLRAKRLREQQLIDSLDPPSPPPPPPTWLGWLKNATATLLSSTFSSSPTVLSVSNSNYPSGGIDGEGNESVTGRSQHLGKRERELLSRRNEWFKGSYFGNDEDSGRIGGEDGDVDGDGDLRGGESGEQSGGGLRRRVASRRRSRSKRNTDKGNKAWWTAEGRAGLVNNIRTTYDRIVNDRRPVSRRLKSAWPMVALLSLDVEDASSTPQQQSQSSSTQQSSEGANGSDGSSSSSSPTSSSRAVPLPPPPSTKSHQPTKLESMLARLFNLADTAIAQMSSSTSYIAQSIPLLIPSLDRSPSSSSLPLYTSSSQTSSSASSSSNSNTPSSSPVSSQQLAALASALFAENTTALIQIFNENAENALILPARSPVLPPIDIYSMFNITKVIVPSSSLPTTSIPPPLPAPNNHGAQNTTSSLNNNNTAPTSLPSPSSPSSSSPSISSPSVPKSDKSLSKSNILLPTDFGIDAENAEVLLHYVAPRFAERMRDLYATEIASAHDVIEREEMASKGYVEVPEDDNVDDHVIKLIGAEAAGLHNDDVPLSQSVSSSSLQSSMCIAGDVSPSPEVMTPIHITRKKGSLFTTLCTSSDSKGNSLVGGSGITDNADQSTQIKPTTDGVDDDEDVKVVSTDSVVKQIQAYKQSIHTLVQPTPTTLTCQDIHTNKPLERQLFPSNNSKLASPSPSPSPSSRRMKYVHVSKLSRHQRIRAFLRAQRWWANGLSSSLPKAPNMTLYSLYGVGKPSERGYIYRINPDPLERYYVPLTIDYRASSERSHIRRGVRVSDGDGTVPIISLGYMCAEGGAWDPSLNHSDPTSLPRLIQRQHQQHTGHPSSSVNHLNPGNVKCVVREFVNTDTVDVLRLAVDSGDHVDIIGNSNLIADVLKIAGRFERGKVKGMREANIIAAAAKSKSNNATSSNHSCDNNSNALSASSPSSISTEETVRRTNEELVLRDTNPAVGGVTGLDSNKDAVYINSDDEEEVDDWGRIQLLKRVHSCIDVIAKKIRLA